MKKIVSAFTLLATMVVLMTGCLKDKGFENGEYGINDPDTQPPGVGFPRAANAKVTYGLDAGSTTPQPVPGLVYVNLESGTTLGSDVTVTLVLNDALRTAYNAANGTNILAMPTNLFSLAPLTLVIPAGQRNIQVPIVINNTTSLDPNSSYGVGVTISAVTNGLKIAQNLKDLFIEFTLKNKYDGRYNLRGYHNRTSPDYSAPYNVTVEMHTSGPNSVTMYWPDAGTYAHPILGGQSYYGSFGANFYFNLTTNEMTGWDWYPYATTLPVGMGPGLNSRYDPTTKTIYASFHYNNNPSGRGFYDTLRYLGPR